MKVAAITMRATTDLATNLAKAQQLVAEAAQQGATFVCLPEMFSIFGLSSYQSFGESETDGEIEQNVSPALAALKAQAQQLSITIAGTLPERLADGLLTGEDQGQGLDQGSKVYNTLFVITADGEVGGKYRKTHLFNLIDPDGTPRYRESDTFVPGESLETATIGGFHTALTTCYDIRFSKVYHALADQQPLDLILAPSAFTAATGAAHWHTLLRSRAIEFQSYVIAANQTGSHGENKACYGHSLIIDPWGEVLADTGPSEGVAIAQISLERVKEVRALLPVYRNQRRDICP